MPEATATDVPGSLPPAGSPHYGGALRPRGPLDQLRALLVSAGASMEQIDLGLRIGLAAVAEEREACAELAHGWAGHTEDGTFPGEEIAAAIRARS